MRDETHPNMTYRFIPAIAPYSAAVRACAGYEVVWATFRHLVPLQTGIGRAVDFVTDRGERPDSICAMSLRAPSPMSLPEFSQFNETYRRLLRANNVLGDDPNPVARTNVAPLISPPEEPAVFGFAFTQRTLQSHPSFVIAGAGELRDQALDKSAIVRPGDTSPEGLREKCRVVIDEMRSRLTAIGVGWADLTAINVYTREDFVPLADDLLSEAGAGAAAGLRWFPSTPPIAGLDFEIDVRATPLELVVD